jgi:tetratricopeptide (TPR) repeat protein
LGKSEEAAAQHERALAIFQRLIDANPKDDWAKWDAALSLDQLGAYYRNAKSDIHRARELYAKALRLREELHAGLHDNVPPLLPADVDKALGNSYASQASFAIATGDLTTARELILKILRRGEAMLADDSQDIAARQMLAGTYELMGGISVKLRDNKEAAEYYEKSLRMRRAIASEEKQSVKAQLDFVKALQRNGDFQLQTLQSPAAAIPYYEESLATCHPLFERDAKDAAIRASLASCYHRLGTAQLLTGQLSLAAESYRQEIPLRQALVKEAPGNISRQIDLMLSLSRAGEHAEAFKVGQSQLPFARENPQILYNILCGFAICAWAAAPGSESSGDSGLVQQYTDAAIETLRRAVELNYRDATALETDPDLASIRSDERFVAILARLKSAPADEAKPARKE